MMKKSDASKSKSALRGTMSENALHAEKKKRGIFGIFFGKNKKGSSMGDSSISSDSAGDRSISPSRSDETPAIPTITSNSPTPPSPVLVSKRLAEEAMIKRNSQLMMNQPKAPARSPQVNGNRSATTKSKKRPAPLPPGPVNHRPQSTPEMSVYGPSARSGVKAAEQVVPSYKKSDSAVSRVNPKAYSNHSPNLSSPDPDAPLRHPRALNGSRSQSISNLVSTPNVSTSNLTHVSSSSNGSLASAIRKRKAPVPPAIEEKPNPLAFNNNNRFGDTDVVSVASDTSATSYDIELKPIETESVVVNASANVATNHIRSVVAPLQPATRPIKLKPSNPANVKDYNSNNKSNYDSNDELELDDEDLEMFSSRTEVEQKIGRKRKTLEKSLHVDCLTSSRTSSVASCATEYFSCSSDEEDLSLKNQKDQKDGKVKLVTDATRRRSFSTSALLEGHDPDSTLSVAATRSFSSDAPATVFPPLTNSITGFHPRSSRGESEDISITSAPNAQRRRAFEKTYHYPDEAAEESTTDMRSSSSSPDRSMLADLTITADSSSSAEEEGYEVLNFQRKKEPVASYCKADVNEEVLKAEPLYTMVIKSPKSIRPTQPQDQKESEKNKVEEMSAESPIMWEYKLPAPPAAFKDVQQSSTAPEDSSSSSDVDSCISVDSLQMDVQVDVQETPVLMIDSVVLNQGSHLLDETPTDDVQVNEVKTHDVVNVVDSIAAKLMDSPGNSTDEEEEEQESPSQVPELRFSISTYHHRVKKDGLSYDKKLSRSESLNLAPSVKPRNLLNSTSSTSHAHPAQLTKSESFRSLNKRHSDPEMNTPEDADKEMTLSAMAADTAPSIQSICETSESSETNEMNETRETKQPEADHLAETTSESAPEMEVLATTPVPSVALPINVDLIQQFQNVLHSISDPQARALQEEFLRLQQQFLTWQLQAALHQGGTVNSAGDCSGPAVQSLSSQLGASEGSPKSDQQDPSRAVPSSPATAQPNNELHRIDEDVTTIEEPLPANNEEEAFRAPQVKLDTWKAGRPHSTVLDHSRSASFSVPEKSVRGPSSEMGDVIDDLFQQAELGAYESPSVASVQVDAHESDANWPVNREIEPVEKAVERVVEVKNVNGNVSVMRKSSFLTARPFEARPVQLPIKRPNFAPMVFHPSRIQRAPEVRGFAALPSTSSDATLSPSSPLSSSSSPSSFPYYKTSPTAGKVRPVSFSIPEKHESGTSLIRNQLIQSAKRPSAEINDFYVDERHSPRSPLSMNAITEKSEDKMAPPRPQAMPVSSSLLLAAAAAASASAAAATTSSIVSPPPLPPIEPVGSVKKLSSEVKSSSLSRFERKPDPREDLLLSIREFANRGALRQTRNIPN